ncbi:MAG: dihydrodipicolinate synthase family protein [Burkholderiaceae bacterium]
MTKRIDENSAGVFVIAPTPFKPDGALDLDSARTMCDFYLDKGASGLTILGIMGEAPKLDPAEATQFTATVLDQVGGRVPVIVGVSSPSLKALGDLAYQSMDQGAAGVMVAPMPSLKTDDAIYGYYAQAIDVLGDIPVCLQDYPQTLGVYFSASLLGRIFKAFPTICMLKHEDSPGLAKLSRFRELCLTEIGRKVSILVGNGAMHLPQEMARGADGAMTGFAFPEMLVQVVDLFKAGEADRAETLFDAYLPLVRHELQPGLGLAARKYVLSRRGAIAHDTLRAPGPKLAAADVAEIEHLWKRLERRLDELRAQGVL